MGDNEKDNAQSDSFLDKCSGNSSQDFVRRGISTEERETWSNKAQSFCTVLGAIIGMGNLWRFPYICYMNGGGAFLIPYLLCVAFMGFPLFFLETALGQLTKQGAIGAWDVAPIMRGVGIGSAVLVTYSNIYFIMVIAWGFFYFFHSFTLHDLPFTTCTNWWNTPNCRPYSYSFNLSSISNEGNINATSNTTTNITPSFPSLTQENRTLPITEFWKRYVLRKSNSLEEYGTLDNWILILCLIVAWIVCYLCIIQGIKSAGKVALFTATIPYLLLGVILVRGCMLEGAIDGVYFYLKPNITKLAEPKVWIQAGGQVCYSYAIGFAAIITMGSFNKFHKDCYKHSILLVGSCASTSFLTGFAVFSILGNLAFVTGRNVSEVVDSGPGLVFQTFPTVLSLLPWPQFWTALFFFMLILIGLDSQFACVECIIVMIIDHWPAAFSSKQKRVLLRSVTCIVLLIFGLMFTPPGGVYLFELFNNYAVSGIAVLWIAMMEAVAIAYVYGIDKFYDDVETMIGYRPSIFVKVCLLYITPLITASIMVSYMVQYTPLTIDGYKYPSWADALGWLLCMSSFLCVPGVFIYTLYKGKGTFSERWKAGTKPKHVDHSLTDAKKNKDKLIL